MANSTSILEVMGPGFFIFFQVDPPGSSGQYQRISGIPEDIKSDDDIAIATAIITLFCNE